MADKLWLVGAGLIIFTQMLSIIILCTNKYMDTVINSIYEDWKGWN